MSDEKSLKSALKKLRKQKENFGFMDRFNVDENIAVTNAIYKQIAQEPYFEGYSYANGEMDYNRWRCINCDRSYGIYYKYDYCPYCGQKLDWKL